MPAQKRTKTAPRSTPRAPRPESPLRRQSKDAQRRLLLDTAANLLVELGPSAISLRNLADAVGASTTVAYTLFGGKRGLVAALHEEGFARLAESFDKAPRGRHPLDHLRSLGLAYRAYALAEPRYFALMIGLTIAGVPPPRASLVRATRAYQLFTDAVLACMRAKFFPRGDPAPIADGLWATAHGMVSLELAGYFPNEIVAETRFLRAITACARGYVRR